MTRILLCLLALPLALTLTACDDGNVIRRPASEADISAPALANVRKELEKEPAPVTAADLIDPAAKNINPFKPAYSYKERAVYERLLEQARQDPDYLTRSLEATKTSFADLVIDVSYGPYEETLRQAATVHASAILGDRMAHTAKTQTIAILDRGIVLGDQSKLKELLTRDEYGDRLADFRKRHYLNYFLTLDEVMKLRSRESIRDEADALTEGI